MLEALSDGRLAMSDLERTQLARLANHSDATIRELAMAVIGAPGPRDELIEQYRER
ncbi:MAG: hypothetical protein R3B96_14920 [Pirellulaceae bacterium]